MLKSLCRKLESIMNRFWWANNKSLKGIHWSKWEPLCKPKCLGGLGFKDMFLFNKPLLAKQVWRILDQPHCLLARVFKARYFPKSDVLSAKIGAYPSFTWRSICNARENNHIQAQEIQHSWSTVNQLIDADSCTWDRTLLLKIVDENTADRILAIPISVSRPEDRVVWKHEGSGEYTVKSGYRVLIAAHLQSTAYMPAIHEVYIDFYKDLWSLSIPDKIKIHIWRLVNNLVWASLSIKFLSFDESLSHKLRFVNTFSAADDQQKRIIGLFGVTNKKFTAVGCYSVLLLELTLKGSGDPPDMGVLKLNFDAAFVKKERTATTAVLARNDTGEIVGAETYLFADIVDAFVAKVRACERALIFARSMCCRRLIVEGDSLTVIKNIQKKGNDNSVISSITHHIYNLGMSFETVSYLVVPREANEAAHALAIEGGKQKELSFFYFGNEIGSSKGSSLIIHGSDSKGKESVADIGAGFLLVGS
ncbi:hypothetical protein Godav_021843, partial [Gossypium davidsonii]|nr:hypothetical protein [Gossypium davidsonii]